MVFKKRNKKADYQTAMAFALEATRKSVSCGLDLERLMRMECERTFDCTIPATMTVTEYIAHMGGVEPELLVSAIRDVVDNGAHPEKYRWFGIKDPTPAAFCGLVTSLYLLNEPEARAA